MGFEEIFTLNLYLKAGSGVEFTTY